MHFVHSFVSNVSLYIFNFGFKVQKIVPTTKKTFEVPIEVVEKFTKLIKSKNLKVKDAITEALQDWITKQA